MCPKRPSEEKENRHENWIVFAWPTEVSFFENLVVLGRQKGGFRVPKRSKISLQVKNVQKAPGSTIPIMNFKDFKVPGGTFLTKSRPKSNVNMAS